MDEAVQDKGFQGIQSLAKFKIIGCGVAGEDFVNILNSEHQNKFENIEIITLNRKLRKDQIGEIEEYIETDLHIPEDDPTLAQEEKQEDEQEVEMEELHPTLWEKFGSFLIKLKNIFRNRQEPEVQEDIEEEPEPEIEEEQEPRLDEDIDEIEIEPEEPEESVQSEPAESEIDYQAEIKALKADAEREIQDIDIVFLYASLEEYRSLDDIEIVARTAHDMNVMNISIIELPRKFTKIDDVHMANRVLQKLRLLADIVVVVPEITKLGHEYVVQAIQGMLKLIVTPGLVNLDFADLKIIVKGGNVALLGFGNARGEDKLKKALNETFDSPLLQVDLKSVEKALVNVTGGEDMTIGEVESVSNAVRKKIKQKSRIIFGAIIDKSLKNEINITLMVGATPMQVLIDVYSES